MHFQHFFWLQKQRSLDIQLFIEIKSPNNVLIYTHNIVLFTYISEKNIFQTKLSFESQPKIELPPVIFGGKKVLG